MIEKIREARHMCALKTHGITYNNIKADNKTTDSNNR